MNRDVYFTQSNLFHTLDLQLKLSIVSDILLNLLQIREDLNKKRMKVYELPCTQANKVEKESFYLKGYSCVIDR